MNWIPGDRRTKLPISLEGTWSPRQAFRVIEAMREQAEAQGLMLVPIDVTDHSMPHARILITVLCRRHDSPVAPGQVCLQCRSEWPR